MKVNRIKWSKIKLQWETKLRSAAAFKGIRDYEEWAISQTPPQIDNIERAIMDELRGVAPLEDPFIDNSWMTPEGLDRGSQGATEKERLFNHAKEVRKQIDAAIDREDYEAAAILQKTLDVIEIKFNKL